MYLSTLQKILFYSFLFALLFPMQCTCADNRVFLNNFNMNLPDHNVRQYVLLGATAYSTSYIENYIRFSAMEIQRIYLTVHDFILTATMNMGEDPILNTSIEYLYSVNFAINETLGLKITFWKDSGSITDTIYSLILANTENGKTENKLVLTGNTQLENNDDNIYWQLDVSKLNSIIPINSLFIPDDVVNQMNEKNQINPQFDGYVKNEYQKGLYGSSYIIDEYHIEANYTVNANRYLGAFFIGLIIIGAIANYIHKNHNIDYEITTYIRY